MKWVALVLIAVAVAGCDDDGGESKVTPYDREAAMAIRVEGEGDLVIAGIAEHKGTPTRGGSLDDPPIAAYPELYVVRTTAEGIPIWEKYFDLNPSFREGDWDARTVAIRGAAENQILIGGVRWNESHNLVLYHLYLAEDGSYLRHADIEIDAPDNLHFVRIEPRSYTGGFCLAAVAPSPINPKVYVFQTDSDDGLLSTTTLNWPSVDDLTVDHDTEVWLCSAESQQVARLNGNGEVLFTWTIPGVQAVEPNSSGFAALDCQDSLLRRRVYTAYLEEPNLLSTQEVELGINLDNLYIIELRFGNLVVAGRRLLADNSSNALILRLGNADTGVLWQVEISEGFGMIPCFIRPDWNEELFIAGRQLPDRNGGDAFLMKVSSGGEFAWLQTYGL